MLKQARNLYPCFQTKSTQIQVTDWPAGPRNCDDDYRRPPQLDAGARFTNRSDTRKKPRNCGKISNRGHLSAWPATRETPSSAPEYCVGEGTAEMSAEHGQQGWRTHPVAVNQDASDLVLGHIILITRRGPALPPAAVDAPRIHHGAPPEECCPTPGSERCFTPSPRLLSSRR
jgi:hypothetical protein